MDSIAQRTSRLSGRQAGLLMALILMFGAGLRVWYGVADPTRLRFWDERYNVANALKVIETWSFEPASMYYPSPLQTWPQALTVAASQRLFEASGIESLEAIDGAGRLTTTGYVLVRLVSALYGTLTLLCLFLLGRRMFSTGVGLLAAFALAAMPWHVHASGIFKPDALLVLTVVVAFYWSLGAVERGRAAGHVFAGFGISLALSAKIMGGLVALPLVLGTFMVGWRDRRRIGLLALAAGTSLASFLILNPYGRWYLDFVAHLRGDYAMRAARQGSTRADALTELGGYLLGPYVHGPLLGLMALAGMAWLMGSVARSHVLSPVERAWRAMLVAFPLLYATALTVATPYFKGNNALPIVPFTLLAGLALLSTGAVAAIGRLPRRGSRTIGFAALVLLIVALGRPGYNYVYRSVTPTTLDQALRFLAAGVDPDFGRLIFSEKVSVGELRSRGPKARGLAVQVVERLDEVSASRLGHADGELFHERRLEESAAEFYRQRIERGQVPRVARFRPRSFKLRGPALVAIRHRPRAAPEWPELRMEHCTSVEETCFTAALPSQVEDGELVSFWLRVPVGMVADPQAIPPLRVGKRGVPLIAMRRRGEEVVFVTERFRLAVGGEEVRIQDLEPGGRATIGLTVCRWGRKRAAPTTGLAVEDAADH